MRVPHGDQWLFIPLVLTILTPLPRARAQDSIPVAGHLVLRGEVRNVSALPIVSAQVNAVGTGVSATTNAKGEFTLAGMSVGAQDIEVLALGYTSRRVQVMLSDTTRFVSLRLDHYAVVLDTQHVVARRLGAMERRKDTITEDEFAQPDVVGGNSRDALELLRPQLLTPRLPMSTSGAKSSAAQRGQIYFRDAKTRDPLGTGAGVMTISVNEGPLQSIDVLTIIPARAVKEMRYLIPTDATARFGVTAGGGPVLIVYTQ
jgi:hypothetical protein